MRSDTFFQIGFSGAGAVGALASHDWLVGYGIAFAGDRVIEPIIGAAGGWIMYVLTAPNPFQERKRTADARARPPVSRDYDETRLI
jgi:hypothetical protein